MYIKRKLFAFFIFGAVLIMVSCTKKLDTNFDNPNGVGINTLTGKDIFPQALLTTVTNKIGADFYDYATQWMGYWARTTNFAAAGSQQQMETFTLNNSFADPIFSGLYHNIYDYNFVEGNSSTNSILPGASIVMSCMVYQDLVDQFGNIPYSTALNPGLTITPTYDTAINIYRDLIVKLDSAIVLIQASQPTGDDTADIMFQGNKTLWTQFANTIKLRILLRQVPNGDQSYVQTEIGNIVSQGSGFLPAGTDATINPGFQDAAQKQSPFWGIYGFEPGSTTGYQNNDFFVANSAMVNFLDSTSDPRIGYFYAVNSSGSYGSNGFGETLTPSGELSLIGPGLLQSATMPAMLFSSSQSLFMQAEAVQRGLMTGNYVSLYTQGVEQSFRYLGVTGSTGAADTYMNGSSNSFVNINLSSNPLQTILYQKWISEDGLDGLEAWSDYRRTGWPVIIPASYSAPGLPLPKRLLYPQSEYDVNSTNVNAQNQIAADIYEKIFWGN